MNDSETENKDDEKTFVDMSEVVMRINGTLVQPTQRNLWSSNTTYRI